MCATFHMPLFHRATTKISNTHVHHKDSTTRTIRGDTIGRVTRSCNDITELARMICQSTSATKTSANVTAATARAQPLSTGRQACSAVVPTITTKHQALFVPMRTLTASKRTTGGVVVTACFSSFLYGSNSGVRSVNSGKKAVHGVDVDECRFHANSIPPQA